MQAKIKDNPSLNRNDGYIVNNDSDAYRNRMNAIQRQKEFDSLKNEVSELKSGMEKILKLLEGKIE